MVVESLSFTILIVVSTRTRIIVVHLIICIIFCQLDCAGPISQRFKTPVLGFWLQGKVVSHSANYRLTVAAAAGSIAWIPDPRKR